MTLVQRQERELDRAIRRSLKQHRSVRAAARALGMPRSTFFDRVCQLGLNRRKKVRRAK